MGVGDLAKLGTIYRITVEGGSGHVCGIDTCPGWQFKDMPPGLRENRRVNNKGHRYRGVNEGGWEKDS